MTLFTAVSGLAASGVRAQISPGELAAPHADLEGSRNCLSCHRPGQGVDRERCLSCHESIKERVLSARGVHARPEYRDCETCHIEHQGRSFELIWWGERGIQAFDHAAAGWPLRGAHQEVPCRECHRRESIATALAPLDSATNVERTFLGLSASCSSCHDDPHRGQFGETSCDSCHGEERFSPAAGFDHAATRFPIDGAHLGLSCSACHPALPPLATGSDAGSAGALRFRHTGGISCRDCHRDPHQGRLAGGCASCHGTASWSMRRREGFDHDQTSFRLIGSHRAVVCEACHGQSFARPRPASQACSDCHADPHLGQFAESSQGQSCASCHGVDRFVPALYTVDEHDRTEFPLRGAHRTQACDSCHTLVSSADVASVLGPRAAALVTEAPVSIRRFRFSSTECESCHADPHQGTAGVADHTSCAECHDSSGWHSVAFSHRRTGYPLESGHHGLPCAECHARVANSSGVESVVFRARGTVCAECHADPHAGQFDQLVAAGSIAPTRCERCHTPGRYRPTIFDHQRDARFPLEGAHAAVACDACHPRVTRDGVELVRYRPISSECSSCHAADAMPPEGLR